MLKTFPLKDSILFLIFILLQIKISICGNSIVLDKETDLFLSWKLRGNYLYIANGFQLEQMADKFPPTFNFNAFATTKGIWAIFPQQLETENEVRSNNNYNNNTSSIPLTTMASFTYSGFAQLIQSVSIRYCIYGESANIIISKSASDLPFYEIQSSGGSSLAIYEWIKTTVPLNQGSSQFFIQASLNGTHDFILIDRIEGKFIESTTTTTTRKTTTTATTTTEKPAPSPTPTSAASLNYHKFGIIYLYIIYLYFTFTCTYT